VPYPNKLGQFGGFENSMQTEGSQDIQTDQEQEIDIYKEIKIIYKNTAKQRALYKQEEIIGNRKA
jgi:hypothetical protein